MRKTFNKLVRDKIPEIIEKDHQGCDIEVLSDDAYLTMLTPSWMKSLPSTMQIKILKSWQTCSRLFTQQPLLVDTPSKIWSLCGWKREQNVVDLMRKFYLKASLAWSETSHIVLYSLLSVYLPLLSPFRPVVWGLCKSGTSKLMQKLQAINHPFETYVKLPASKIVLLQCVKLYDLRPIWNLCKSDTSKPASPSFFSKVVFETYVNHVKLDTSSQKRHASFIFEPI